MDGGWWIYIPWVGREYLSIYLSIDSFSWYSARKQLNAPIGLNWAAVPLSSADIIYYARSPRYDSIEINFGTLYKRTTVVVSCLVDIFMTILLLLMQMLFKPIGDAKNLQILLEVRR